MVVENGDLRKHIRDQIRFSSIKPVVQMFVVPMQGFGTHDPLVLLCYTSQGTPPHGRAFIPVVPEIGIRILWLYTLGAPYKPLAHLRLNASLSYEETQIFTSSEEFQSCNLNACLPEKLIWESQGGKTNWVWDVGLVAVFRDCQDQQCHGSLQLTTHIHWT